MSVKVAKHPETGNIITPSTNNPEWGTIRVDSENKSFAGGILNVSKRSAFIRGKISDLESLGLREGQMLPGKIQKQESFQPFYVAGQNGATTTQNPKINPTTGEVVLTNGRETYLQFEYVEDPNAPDIWVNESPAEVAENAQEALAGQAI